MVNKLAAHLPVYRLPGAVAAHSRHYMPLGTTKNGREDTALVYDAWAHVGEGAITMQWDCDLSPEETNELKTLLSCLNYLGRSESWVEGELAGGPGIVEADAGVLPWDAIPHAQGLHPGPGWEQVLLMAAVPPDEFETWRTGALATVLADLPLPRENRKASPKLLRQRDLAAAAYPETLLDCLTKDSAWWKERRWSQPLGSRKVVYWRRTDALEVEMPAETPQRTRPRVTFMLLALTTRGGSRGALPPCTRILPQAELFHRAMISRAGRGGPVDCPELTGFDRNRRKLQSGHQHAHVLPLDLDLDGRIDHVLVYAPMGLGGIAQEAIRSLRRTWTKGGAGELQLAIAAAGPAEVLRSLGDPVGPALERLVAPPGGARQWESVTPFLPPRFLKKRGPNALAGQVNAELLSRGFPAAIKIEVDAASPNSLAMRHFVRRRQRGGPPPPVDQPFRLSLHFAEPVTGPLCLGYASHYGLGLFSAR